jgi:3-oxoacyl-[acyl-carrier protein] reductase
MSLQGKVILITGASNGIGAGLSTHLSSLGASIVINYRSDSAAAEKLVSSCGGSDRAIAVQADVSSLPGLDKLVAAAVDKFGRIDVAIANAGLMLMRDVGSTTEEDFDRQFNLNVKGPYFLAQVCSAPHV